MLPARHRLRARRDFAVAVRGRRAGNRLLVVHATAPDQRRGMPVRVGLAVSRAVGNSVVRNRTKRVLRARLAPLITALPPGLDLVIRAQPAVASASSDEVNQALSNALHRAVGRTATGRGNA